jgi:nucleoid-associated protein YgaU
MTGRIRTAVTVFAYVLCAAAAHGQSLQGNADYNAAKNLQEVARQALLLGDYDSALRYSNEAKQYADKAEDFASVLLVRFKASNWLALATQKMADSERMGAKTRYAKEYAKASDNYVNAQAAFTGEKYEESIGFSKAAIDSLADVEPQVLPQYYVVRLIPEDRDTLNKISGYPWVYDDRTKWRVLYDANREKLRYPNDPDWIYPGQTFVIPSIAGETREGTYDPGIEYPAFQQY